jgi:hypothetical protein
MTKREPKMTAALLRGGGVGGGREGEGAKGDARDATSVVLAEGIDLHHLRSVLCKAD